MTNNVITILPDGTEICVSTSDISVYVNNGLCIEVSGNTGVNIGAWLSSLIEFDSDYLAFQGGIPLYGWYKTSDQHDSAPGGIPKQVRYTT